MRLQRADRRRLAFASALTIFALPAVWLANRDEPPARPNVAVAGLGAERAGRPADTVTPTSVDPMGGMDPLFEGNRPRRARRPTPVSAAVGSPDTEIVATAEATHSRSIYDDSCHFAGVPAGTEVTVVNPDNGRSLECVISPGTDELTVHPDRFVQLADLIAAPVRVELHVRR